MRSLGAACAVLRWPASMAAVAPASVSRPNCRRFVLDMGFLLANEISVREAERGHHGIGGGRIATSGSGRPRAPRGVWIGETALSPALGPVRRTGPTGIMAACGRFGFRRGR